MVGLLTCSLVITKNGLEQLKKNLFASTRPSAMIATHVAVEAVGAVIQIATLLVKQSTSVGGSKGYNI